MFNLKKYGDTFWKSLATIIDSTPALFAAQAAIENAMKSLKENDGLLPTGKMKVDVQACTAILNENLARRDK